MKLPLVLITILLVPLFAWLNHRRYENELKPKLLEQVREALRSEPLKELSPEVSADVQLDQLDVVLRGEAPTPALREKAREVADAVPGARATEVRNHITVPGRLKIERTPGGLMASGLVPPDVQERVLNNLESRGFTVPAGQWISESFVRGPEWLWKPGFENWLTDFLSTSGARWLSVEGNTIELKGDATTELGEKWVNGLEAMLPRGTAVKSDFRFFPSIYHLPGYKHSSAIGEDVYTKVSGVLAASDIHFDLGSSALAEVELPKVQAIADAIKTAGSGISYALGGHTDVTGDRQANLLLSRERALAVSAKLTELGVPADALEVVAFGASQTVGSNETEASRQLSRRVEVIVK
jgi:outer membrane protein OmpA-like peptidoglycan-associated protein